MKTFILILAALFLQINFSMSQNLNIKVSFLVLNMERIHAVQTFKRNLTEKNKQDISHQIELLYTNLIYHSDEKNLSQLTNNQILHMTPTGVEKTVNNSLRISKSTLNHCKKLLEYNDTLDTINKHFLYEYLVHYYLNRFDRNIWFMIPEYCFSDSLLNTIYKFMKIESFHESVNGLTLFENIYPGNYTDTDELGIPLYSPYFKVESTLVKKLIERLTQQANTDNEVELFLELLKESLTDNSVLLVHIH